MFYKIDFSLLRRFKYIDENLSISGIKRSQCEFCEREIAEIEYFSNNPLMVLDGGKTYPDLLMYCSVGIRPFIISKKALDIFEANGVTGMAGAFKVEFQNSSDDSEYYCIDISGSIDMDLKRMQLKRKRICTHCGQFDWNRKSLGKIIPNVSSWNGEDLCRIKSIPSAFVCTEKILKLVKDNKLTGFEFVSLQV